MAGVAAKALDPQELKVWLGVLKLDNAYPTQEALQRLLYGSESGSAEDADVIAIFLTDLLLSEESVDAHRHMLQRALRNPGDYVVNEEDRNLLLRHIPAQLVKSSGNGGRYVSMSVAVHRRNVTVGLEPGSGGEIFSVFPAPVMLTCKSPRKNLREPSFKGVLAQLVVLRRGDREIDLALLGANLDTQTQPRLAQLEALERFIEIRRRSAPFCAVMWGDFNNRIVAFEELRPRLQERSPGKFRITDDGVTWLADLLGSASGRRELLAKDDLVFSGRDINATECSPSKSSAKLRQMFSLHVDAKHLEVPLPTYKRTPLSHLLSEQLGLRVQLEDVVVLDALDVNRIHWEHLGNDTFSRYFAWHTPGAEDEWPQREIKTDPSDMGEESLYLQCGWPDGVALYRDSSLDAQLEAWESDTSVMTTDHLPLRAVVKVDWPGGPELKVWLGFAKLGEKTPSAAVLERFFYSSADASAENADVIALYVTDLLLTSQNVESMRNMLQQVLHNPADYCLNEHSPNLPIRNIPAQLAKLSDRGGRYVSMWVAVHKRNVESLDGDDDVYGSGCFPLPVHLSCKSPRKNELQPSFKAILVQEVLLVRDHVRLDFLLLGANLDTQHEPMLAQLEALHRMLRTRPSSNLSSAIMWGDLNHRLVAYEELQPHIRALAPGDFELTESGCEVLSRCIADPVGRRELLLKDASLYSGRDIQGRQCEVSRASLMLRRLFSLHIDAVLEGRLEVPMPFYKHTPCNDMLSKMLGCRLRVDDVVHVRMTKDVGLATPWSTLETSYFGWQNLQRTVKADNSGGGSPEDSTMYLQLGWLDGVGIYRGGSVPAELRVWETEDQVLAFDHMPLRAVVGLTML